MKDENVAVQPKNAVLVSVHEELVPPVWFEKIHPFVMAVLDKQGYSGWELSVMFCDDEFIRTLNSQYRGIDSPTDVLSFELGERYTDESGTEWFSAGDIVISLDTLLCNAQEFSVAPDEELKRLLIHGILHLAGYDHNDNSPEQEMLRLQESILSNFLSEADTIIEKQ